jgi:hypothetical protein
MADKSYRFYYRQHFRGNIGNNDPVQFLELNLPRNNSLGKYESYPNIQFRLEATLLDNGTKMECKYSITEDNGTTFTNLPISPIIFLINNSNTILPIVSLIGVFNYNDYMTNEVIRVDNVSIVQTGTNITEYTPPIIDNTLIDKTSLIQIAGTDLYKSLNCNVGDVNNNIIDRITVMNGVFSYVLSPRLTTNNVIIATPRVIGNYGGSYSGLSNKSIFIGLIETTHNSYGLTQQDFINSSINLTGIDIYVDAITSNWDVNTIYRFYYSSYNRGIYTANNTTQFYEITQLNNKTSYESYPDVQFKIESAIVDNGSKLEYSLYVGDGNGFKNITNGTFSYVLNTPRRIYPFIGLNGAFGGTVISDELIEVRNVSITHTGFDFEDYPSPVIDDSYFNKTSLTYIPDVGYYKSLNCNIGSISNSIISRISCPKGNIGYLISEKLTEITEITATPRVIGNYNGYYSSDTCTFIGFIDSTHDMDGFNINNMTNFSMHMMGIVVYATMTASNNNSRVTYRLYYRRYFRGDIAYSPPVLILEFEQMMSDKKYSQYPNISFRVKSNIIDNWTKMECRFYTGVDDIFTEIPYTVVTYVIPNPRTIYPFIGFINTFGNSYIEDESVEILNASIKHTGTNLEDSPGYVLNRTISNKNTSVTSRNNTTDTNNISLLNDLDTDIITSTTELDTTIHDTITNITDRPDTSSDSFNTTLITQVKDTNWYRSLDCIVGAVYTNTTNQNIMDECAVAYNNYGYLIGKEIVTKNTEIIATPKNVYMLQSNTSKLPFDKVLERYLYIGFINSEHSSDGITYETYITNKCPDRCPLFLAGILIYTTIKSDESGDKYNYNYRLYSKNGFELNATYYTTNAIKTNAIIVPETEPNIQFKMTYKLIDNNTKAECRYYIEIDNVLTEIKNTVQTFIDPEKNTIYPFIGLNNKFDTMGRTYTVAKLTNISLN